MSSPASFVFRLIETRIGENMPSFLKGIALESEKESSSQLFTEIPFHRWMFHYGFQDKLEGKDLRDARIWAALYIPEALLRTLIEEVCLIGHRFLEVCTKIQERKWEPELTLKDRGVIVKKQETSLVFTIYALKNPLLAKKVYQAKEVLQMGSLSISPNWEPLPRGTPYKGDCFKAKGLFHLVSNFYPKQ